MTNAEARKQLIHVFTELNEPENVIPVWKWLCRMMGDYFSFTEINHDSHRDVLVVPGCPFCEAKK